MGLIAYPTAYTLDAGEGVHGLLLCLNGQQPSHRLKIPSRPLEGHASRGSFGGARPGAESAALTSINVGVEETQDELEVRLLAGYERHDGQLVSRRVSPSCVSWWLVSRGCRGKIEILGGGERLRLLLLVGSMWALGQPSRAPMLPWS